MDELQCCTIEKCCIHNNEYTRICECGLLYCDKCNSLCNNSCWHVYTIEEWKKQALIQIEKFQNKLNNKIKGLNCITEMIIINHHDCKSLIKQIEDIIDTIYVYINHIENFYEFINDDNIPISHIIKRKNNIINSKIAISLDNIPEHLTRIINIIIKNDGDIHYNNDYVLMNAAENGQYDVVECLIKYGANVHTNHDYALILASNNGHLDVVKCLIKNGAGLAASPRPDKVGNDDGSLRYASQNGHLVVVEYLIKHGADIHAKNNEALRWASMYGRLAVVEYLKQIMNN